MKARAVAPLTLMVLALVAGHRIGSTYAAIPGFSNKAHNNRVTVTMRKKGDLLQIFVGQTRIGDFPKSVPEALQFNAMVFSLSGDAGPNDHMYISNIRVTKD